jgi:Rha family phage regulatory protein
MTEQTSLEQPVINVVSGQMTVSSLDVARHFEKRHDNVLQAIENLKNDCPEEFHLLNFQEMLYEQEIGSGAVRQFPACELTRDGFSLLVMGFTGKQAMAWKIRYIEAFNAMEKALIGKKAVNPGACDPQEINALVGLARTLAYFDQQRPHVIMHDVCDFCGVASVEDITKKDIGRAFKYIKQRLFSFADEPGARYPLTSEQLAVIEGLADYAHWIQYDGPFSNQGGNGRKVLRYENGDVPLVVKIA